MDSDYLTTSAADCRILENLLGSLLTKSLQLPARGTASLTDGSVSSTLQILDLACGTCREMESISSALKKATSSGNAGIRFVGADIRGAEIDEAKARARALTSPDFKAEFLLDDCSKIDAHSELGSEFDMVFLRHQNYWNEPNTWIRIFLRGLERLGDKGVLVITSYFDREHDLAVKAIKEAGGELIISVRNPDSRPLPTPGKSVDRHLAVFRRRVKASPEPGIIL